MIGGSPRCPAARRRRVLLGGGYPSPFPPFAAGRVRCGRPFGGAPRLRPSAVGLPRSDSSMGAPLWFLVSPSRGVSRWCSQGFPPAPSLRALGVRFWVEDPPLPSPPCRPLALGALDRSGGALYSVSPSAVARSALALLGVCPPPPPDGSARCVLWSHGRPPPAQALLCLILPPTPPSPLCHTRDAGARRFQLWLQLRRWSVQAGALRRRIPPTSPSPRPVLPSRLVAPHLLCHQSVAPWCFGRWVGFRPLLPDPVRPPPVGIGTLWGLPGFCLPWVPHLLWGSICPMMT